MESPSWRCSTSQLCRLPMICCDNRLHQASASPLCCGSVVSGRRACSQIIPSPKEPVATYLRHASEEYPHCWPTRSSTSGALRFAAFTSSGCEFFDYLLSFLFFFCSVVVLGFYFFVSICCCIVLFFCFSVFLIVHRMFVCRSLFFIPFWVRYIFFWCLGSVVL